jgi:4-amino-4-deoxy-L-arabinose transferase-like glycosyltransferase
MIMAHTIMPDLPLVAFFLLSLTLFIYGYDRANRRLLILSGIFASISVMMRYNALSIIPIIILYYILFFNKRKKWYILAALMPFATFVLWNIFTKIVYGEIHFISQLTFQSYLGQRNLITLIRHLVPHLSYLGGGTVFTFLLLMPVLHKNKINKIIFIIVGVFVFPGVLHLRDWMNYDYMHIRLAALFIFSILYLLFVRFKDVFLAFFSKKVILRDEIFLLLWIAVILIMQNSGKHSAAKYMITVIPPVVILIMKDKYLESIKRAYRNLIIYTALLLTGIIGFAAAAADYEFAEVNRKIADYCAENIKVGKNNSVWFLGHWGFQYYMEEKGFTPYEQYTNEPQKNDIIVISILAMPQSMNFRLKDRIDLVDKLVYNGKTPIKIMHNNKGKHANFYAFVNAGSGYGILPFSFSRAPIDEFKVFQVVKN